MYSHNNVTDSEITSDPNIYFLAGDEVMVQLELAFCIWYYLVLHSPQRDTHPFYLDRYFKIVLHVS